MVVSAWVAVIITVPDRKTVTSVPTTEAMVMSELTYENAPGLFETGCVRVNVPKLEYVCAAIVKLMDGFALLIINVACMLAVV